MAPRRPENQMTASSLTRMRFSGLRHALASMATGKTEQPRDSRQSASVRRKPLAHPWACRQRHHLVVNDVTRPRREIDSRNRNGSAEGSVAIIDEVAGNVPTRNRNHAVLPLGALDTAGGEDVTHQSLRVE